MLAGSSSSITNAASTVVRDNLNKNVVLMSNKEDMFYIQFSQKPIPCGYINNLFFCFIVIYTLKSVGW